MSTTNTDGKRAMVRLAAWNVRGYASNRDEAERLLQSGEADVLFISETKLEDVAILAESKGQVLTMAAPIIKRRPTMGIAFMSRERGVFRREDAVEGSRRKWQMLVVKMRGIRIIGIYASPSATTTD